MVDVIDTAIYGFIGIFVVCVITAVGIYVLNEQISPLMRGLMNDTTVTPIQNFDYDTIYNRTFNTGLVALGLVIAGAFLLIIFHFLFERERYYG